MAKRTDDKAPVRALVVDAHGTSFDVNSISIGCESLFPGKGADLSRVWRTKQLEYTWLRSLMGRYTEFEALTRDALGIASRTLGLAVTESDTTLLMQSYRELQPFPEIKDALPARSDSCRPISGT